MCTKYPVPKGNLKCVLINCGPSNKHRKYVFAFFQAIQNMGNLGSQLGSAKEAFMQPLHPLIRDNVGKVKEFLDGLVDVSDKLGKRGQSSIRRRENKNDIWQTSKKFQPSKLIAHNVRA